MKLFFILPALLLTAVVHAQPVEVTRTDTLWCPNDTFALRFKGDSARDYFTASRKDKVSPGTDAAPGEYAVLYYGKDSLRLIYHNRLPYAHIFYVHFASPKGRTTLRFHFNELSSYFPASYRGQHRGKSQVDVPEAYELANIIWTLSPSGQRATDLNKQGPYYQRVLDYFRPFLRHPVFKALNFPDSVYSQKYYDFRENSFAFNFANSRAATPLLFNGPYYYVYGNELADSSLFGKLRPLVEDFARVSRFRDFYKSNQGYYAQQVRRQEQLLPLTQMWHWLEREFPKRKFQSYRVVFSPLIGGSHSTQQYATYEPGGWYQESVMFICGPDRYDADASLSEKQKEGLLSGVVFTEIDHNYVNPTTGNYRKTVDSIFANRTAWTRPGAGTDFYGSPLSIFNEYMTHALFCLYVQETYDPATAGFVIAKREDLMVDRRGFTQFREFDRELLRLRAAHPGRVVTDLYPQVLAWCRSYNRVETAPSSPSH
ncbi:DUF4932 domain-containing protein [Flaviaesturariibacter flavus]|uniref:DUF4932 domain-containing protein n=1 Tax=Flaviaesturariibacter flavus TaxID=2502780 RepID=A0A4V2NVN0_9BACT|nr:DUF4932 domain-containing protein [Flaviaesturariibacter flavus]TCJ14022.1 DUF4932 domain-containing protein [Flaviaesturariibacter flavus]